MTKTLANWATLLLGMESALARPNGGFVVDPHTGQDVFDGYAVFLHPEWQKIIDGPVTATHLCDYVASVGDVLDEPARMLVGWHDPDTGQTHLDVCVLVQQRSTVRNAAVRVLGLFDLYRWKSVPAACAA